MGWTYTWTALDELVLSDPDGSSWPHSTSVITQGIFNNSFFKVKGIVQPFKTGVMGGII
jgi:hypothetical protein